MGRFVAILHGTLHIKEPLLDSILCIIGQSGHSTTNTQFLEKVIGTNGISLKLCFAVSDCYIFFYNWLLFRLFQSRTAIIHFLASIPLCPIPHTLNKTTAMKFLCKENYRDPSGLVEPFASFNRYASNRTDGSGCFLWPIKFGNLSRAFDGNYGAVKVKLLGLKGERSAGSSRVMRLCMWAKFAR